MLEPGAIIGDRYRVGRALGKGGMGVVVEATHLQLGTQVAIKVLKKDGADAANMERFMREARAAAKLRGEHICRVHDFGTLPDGAPYMVMELLHGQDLATMLKASGPMAQGDLARYMLEVCTAIAEAHAAGIVHRDLKPGNLYVVERVDGVQVIKVLDFGIAKSIEKKDFALTDTTSVMGSPVYMSPEQLKSSKSVDARSDIWSLGVVMYEMLIGKHPFNGETLTELAISIANDPLPPFPEHVSPAFAALIVKCLEKDPNRRFPDVAALAAALEPLAKQNASVAGAIRRTLNTGSVAAIPEGPATQPSLPSNLAGPDVTAKLANGKSLTRAISEVANAKETTTLRGASGAMLAQTGERPRPRWMLPAFGAALVAITVVTALFVSRDGGEVNDSTAAPAAQPTAVEPTAAPPPPAAVAPPPSPEPVQVPPQNPADTDGETVTAETVTPETVTAAPTDVDPTKPTKSTKSQTTQPTKPTKTTKSTKSTKPTKPIKSTTSTSPSDLSKSRY